MQWSAIRQALAASDGEDRRTPILLFAAGINLILLQLFMIREFAITLFSTELILLLVTVAYFTGYSLGYLLAERISTRCVKPWLVGIVVAHLPMIAGARFLSGYMATRDLSQWTIPLIVAVTALAMTSFYTIFLPRAVSAEGSSPRGLARCYSIELAGSATGLALAMILGAWWVGSLAILYLAILLLIAWCLRSSGFFLGLVGVMAAAVLMAMPVLDKTSAEYFYENYFGWIDEPDLLYSTHTPYQKIDVLQTTDGRSLYLNGLEYFNTDDLEWFNFFLSEVPARMAARRSPPEVLIVGSGSMSSLQHLAPVAAHITTVEIDPAVVEVGRTYFSDFNRLDTVQGKWTLVIDDAKHFLSTTEQRFDLVIVDVPAPWYVQTGLLFTQEFYHLAKKRLNPGGMISVYLTESFSPWRPLRVSSQILAALRAEFQDLFVVDSADAPYGFAMAGDTLGFDRNDIVETVRGQRPDVRFRVYDRPQIVRVIGNTRPSSYDNLDIVWDLNFWALPY